MWRKNSPPTPIPVTRHLFRNSIAQRKKKINASIKSPLFFQFKVPIMSQSPGWVFVIMVALCILCMYNSMLKWMQSHVLLCWDLLSHVLFKLNWRSIGPNCLCGWYAQWKCLEKALTFHLLLFVGITSLHGIECFPLTWQLLVLFFRGCQCFHN